MAGKKVGLALGGGGARGLAHIGVLEVLEKAGIAVDIVVGTSIGAIIGALHAQGKSAAWVRSLAMNMLVNRAKLFGELSLSKTGLIQGRKLERNLKPIFGDTRFEDLELPFACTATDICTGEEVVIKQGPVWDAIRASASLPVLLAVANRQGQYLVDGGLIDPVPVKVTREMGADIVIAVNVLPRKTEHEVKEPNVFTVAMHLVYVLNHQLVSTSISGADIIIEPQVGHIGFAEFQRTEECMHLGRMAALDALPRLAKFLEAGS